MWGGRGEWIGVEEGGGGAGTRLRAEGGARPCAEQ